LFKSKKILHFDQLYIGSAILNFEILIIDSQSATLKHLIRRELDANYILKNVRRKRVSIFFFFILSYINFSRICIAA